jgi:trimeric autotransporter adhesin
MKDISYLLRGVVLCVCLLLPRSIPAQGTAFSYQGRLDNGGAAANGSYDLRFTVYDSASLPGTIIAGPITNSATSVSNGLFTVSLDFGGGVFAGQDRWLEIGVRTNSGGAFASLSPRQALTATPYAVFAGAVASGGLAAGTYGSAIIFSNAANSFFGNGTGLANVNAVSLNGFGAASFWNVAGNAATIPGTQFLGTTDNLPLELKVNGARALRLEPNPNAPNVIGGSAANEVTNGNYGAVIGGGGSSAYPNRVGAIFGTVVGGNGNTASGNYATAMGQFNTASGYGATAMGYSTVAGGFASQAGGTSAKANHDGTFVWADNTFADFTSTAANQFLIRAASGVGINTNDPNGAALSVNGNVTVNNRLGTTGDQPLELYANNQRALRLEPTGNADMVNVIGGSALNFVAAGVFGATIGGGGGSFSGIAYTNSVEAVFGTVSGGLGNGVQSFCFAATIGGGWSNSIQFSAQSSTIGGGDQNSIHGANFATVGGGAANMIQTSANDSTIGGGAANTIQTSASDSTIGGGLLNTIQDHTTYGTLGGGSINTIQSSANYSTVGGGGNNVVQTNGGASTIAGGSDNTIQVGGTYGTIPGGQANSATNYAFAAGRRAKANHTGAFVWADSTDADFASTTNNQFAIRAAGGVALSSTTPNLSFGAQTRQMINLWTTQYGIGVQPFRFYFRTDAGAGFAWFSGGTHNESTDNPGAGGTEVMKLDGTGLTVRGTFVSSSDRNLKENFAQINPRAVLDKVAALPISSWNYKEDKRSPHIGPMAQDFYAAFSVGPDDKHITTIDEGGVALAAIQGLNQKVEERDAEITALKGRLEKLERLVQSQKAQN